MATFKVKTNEIWYVEVEYTVDSNNPGNAVAYLKTNFGQLPYDDFQWDDGRITHIIDVEELS